MTTPQQYERAIRNASDHGPDQTDGMDRESQANRTDLETRRIAGAEETAQTRTIMDE